MGSFSDKDRRQSYLQDNHYRRSRETFVFVPAQSHGKQEVNSIRKFCLQLPAKQSLPWVKNTVDGRCTFFGGIFFGGVLTRNQGDNKRLGPLILRHAQLQDHEATHFGIPIALSECSRLWVVYSNFLFIFHLLNNIVYLFHVGFNGNPPLRDIFSHFSREVKQMEVRI